MANRQTDANAPDESLVKAKSDALRLLSVRPRGSAELAKRLTAKRHDPAVVRQVIEQLTRQGMIDDAKFAKLYAESKLYTRPVSRDRLLREMSRLGIDEKTAATAVGSVSGVDERQAARELVAGRFDRMRGLAPGKKKARLYGFLKRRGYSNDVIFSVLDELFDSAEQDSLQ